MRTYFISARVFDECCTALATRVGYLIAQVFGATPKKLQIWNMESTLRDDTARLTNHKHAVAQGTDSQRSPPSMHETHLRRRY